MIVYVYELSFFVFCLGEEVEGKPRLVRGHSVALQVTESEIEGGFEFRDSEDWGSPIDNTAWIERKGIAYQLLLGGNFLFYFLPNFAAHFVVFAKPSLQCYNCCSIESFITLFSMKWIFWGECEFNDIWISWISWCLYDILDIVIDYWFDIGAYCLFQALDEVQTYILVERTLKDKNLGADSIVQEYLHVVSSFFFLYSRCVVCGHRQILDTSCDGWVKVFVGFSCGYPTDVNIFNLVEMSCTCEFFLFFVFCIQIWDASIEAFLHCWPLVWLLLLLLWRYCFSITWNGSAYWNVPGGFLCMLVSKS